MGVSAGGEVGDVALEWGLRLRGKAWLVCWGGVAALLEEAKGQEEGSGANE